MKSGSLAIRFFLLAESHDALFVHHSSDSSQYILDAVILDLLVNLLLMVEIITDGVVHPGKLQVGEASQNGFNGFSRFPQSGNVPHGNARVADHRRITTDSGRSHYVRMLGCNIGAHSSSPYRLNK